MEGVGEGEQDHKKSVLKKVKDKAKRIKDTIKKHGHDHDDGDDDEIMVNDHEVHGGPIIESTVIKSKNIPKETNVNSEKPTNTQEDQYGRNVRGEEVNRQSSPGQMAPESGSPRAMEGRVHEHTNKPASDPTTIDMKKPDFEESKAKLGPTDGGNKPDVSPLVHQFDNLNVHDVPQPNPIKNQFNPESNPTSTPENLETNPKSQNTITGNQGGDTATEKEVNKGASVREYLAEKFRPGDEDKALSEVITNAFHKKKDGRQRAGEEHPVGKVTESKEVAARLGTGEENKREGEDALASGAESSGQGVVDRLKDAVGSWLGKSTAMETAQDSVSKSYVSDVGSVPSTVERGDEVTGQQRNQATTN